VTASDFEQKVAHELQSLEVGGSAIKAQLKNLYITAAKQIEVDGAKKAIVIFVPFRLLKNFRAIQKQLVDELEKKFGGNHVVIIGQRTMLKPTCNRNIKHHGIRPRSRTLTAVQEAMLDDLVYPSEITGKRTRCRVDGSKLMKVQLHKRDQTALEGKLDTFGAVYKVLTNKTAVFEFPARR
jgi:small subunit ribosomal protein S7e